MAVLKYLTGYPEPLVAQVSELLAQGKNNLQAPWLGLTGFVVIAATMSLLIFVGEAVRDGGRATVTQADLHYVGSVTVDEDLLDAADLLPGELVRLHAAIAAWTWYGPGRPIARAESRSPVPSLISARSQRLRSCSSSGTSTPSRTRWERRDSVSISSARRPRTSGSSGIKRSSTRARCSASPVRSRAPSTSSYPSLKIR